jgi:photosystem II stability/assembly factor-like uncharacterized protein
MKTKNTLLILLVLFLITLLDFISLNAQWERCNNDEPSCEIYAFISDSNYLYAGFDCGLYRSSDNGDSWILINEKLGVNAFAIKDNKIFAATDKLYLSTDNGDNWAQKPIKYLDSLHNNGYLVIIETILIDSNNIFIGTTLGILKSTDNGDNWVLKNNGLNYDNPLWVNSLAIKDKNIFVGMEYQGIYISTDNGNNWIPKSNGLTNNYITALAVKDNYIYAACFVENCL